MYFCKSYIRKSVIQFVEKPVATVEVRVGDSSGNTTRTSNRKVWKDNPTFLCTLEMYVPNNRTTVRDPIQNP